MAAALRLRAFLLLLLLLLPPPPLWAAEPSAEPAAPPETRAAASARPRSGPAPVTDGGCPVGLCGAGSAGHRRRFPAKGSLAHGLSRASCRRWVLVPTPAPVAAARDWDEPARQLPCCSLGSPGDLPGLWCSEHPSPAAPHSSQGSEPPQAQQALCSPQGLGALIPAHAGSSAHPAPCPEPTGQSSASQRGPSFSLGGLGNLGFHTQLDACTPFAPRLLIHPQLCGSVAVLWRYRSQIFVTVLSEGVSHCLLIARYTFI